MEARFPRLNVLLVKPALEAKHVTQAKLARLMHLSRQRVNHFYRMEREVPQQYLAFLSELSGISEDKLIINVTKAEIIAIRAELDNRKTSSRAIVEPGPDVITDNTFNSTPPEKTDQSQMTEHSVEDEHGLGEKCKSQQIAKGRIQIIKAMVAFVVICLLFFTLQSRFRVFPDLSKDRFQYYPAIFFFSFAYFSCAAREMLVADTDVLVRRLTKIGATVFASLFFIWMFGLSFLRVFVFA